MIKLDSVTKGVSRYTSCMQASESTEDKLVQRPKETFGVVSLIGRATPVNHTDENATFVSETFVSTYISNILVDLKSKVKQRRTYGPKALYNALLKGTVSAAILKNVAILRKMLSEYGTVASTNVVGIEVYQNLNAVEQLAKAAAVNSIAFPHTQDILDVCGHAYFDRADAHVFVMMEDIVYDSVSPDGSSTTENWETIHFPTEFGPYIAVILSECFQALRTMLLRVEANGGVETEQVTADILEYMPQLRTRTFSANSSNKEKLRTMLANSQWLGDYEAEDDKVDPHGRFSVSKVGPKYFSSALSTLYNTSDDVIIDLVSVAKEGCEPVELAGVPWGLEGFKTENEVIPQAFFNSEIIIGQAALYGVTDTDVQDSAAYYLLFEDNTENAAQIFEFFRGIGMMPGYGLIIGTGKTAGYLASSEVSDYYYHHPVAAPDLANIVMIDYVNQIFNWTTKNTPRKAKTNGPRRYHLTDRDSKDSNANFESHIR